MYSISIERPPKQGLHVFSSPRRTLATILFWSLGSTLMVVGSVLMVGHWYTLPLPPMSDGSTARAVASLREDARRGAWMAVHVLYARCRCSQRVLDHLFHSERPTAVDEHVLFIGADVDHSRRARARGFTVHVLEPKELKELYRIESAPLLLILDPSNELRYVGGYTDRKQGAAIHDLEILNQLIADGVVEPRPLFGCGVSRELQKLLDPIGIKYTGDSE